MSPFWKYIAAILAVPFTILFALYLLICFPLFCFTTGSSLMVTATRISFVLFRKRRLGKNKSITEIQDIDERITI